MSRPEISPGFACVVGHHIFVDIHDAATGEVVGGWCLWCGTGVSDPDRISDDGRMRFVPDLRVRVPKGWHRLPTHP